NHFLFVSLLSFYKIFILENMDPNNNPINTQNSTNYPFHYPNPNNFQFQNQFSNQPHPQNIPNYGFPPNFSMPSEVLP
ncbi:unnamed protein product, partial [Arabidopsis halleri]